MAGEKPGTDSKNGSASMPSQALITMTSIVCGSTMAKFGALKSGVDATLTVSPPIRLTNDGVDDVVVAVAEAVAEGALEAADGGEGPRTGGTKCTSLVRSSGQSSRMRMPCSLSTTLRPSFSRQNYDDDDVRSTSERASDQARLGRHTSFMAAAAAAREARARGKGR